MAAWYRAGLEPAALALLALVVRLLHVRYTAKALVADDAVFFEEHAQRFLDAWAAIGTPGFAPLLREAVDHASLQGIVYPLFQSLVYGLAGGVQHTALLTAQAVLGALTVWLTYLTAREAFGRVAALAAGLLAATYPPFVLASGLLLAEALLLFIQALALYFLVRGLTRRLTWSRILGGFCIGLLMLRPAFQYAGPILFIALAAIGALGATPGAGARLRSAVQLAAPYLGGVLIVALPWLAVNGLVYGSFVWARTGDAWQQVYWGIYPPNRGWWPPDSPVPPKYGVDSLPGAWAAGIEIEAHDLDYLEAAVDQVRATPLQALATVVNKLYQAYLHPFNTYAEHPPLVGPLAVPLHRLLGLLALAGLCLAWLRPAPAAVLGAALSAISLPFLASHIDVRYTIPAAQIGTSFAGLAVAQLGQALRHRATWPYVLGIALPFGAWAIGVPHLVGLAPGFAPWHAHLLNATLVCAAFVAAGWAAGRLLAVDGAADSRPLAAIWAGSSAVKPSARTLCLASGVAAGGLLAGIYGIQAIYDGDWHQWSVDVPSGGAVRQTFVLPAGWRPPPGARAEVRLYVQGAPEQVYVPVVRANGREVARLGPAFTDAGPLRFDERIMLSARRQGKARADVPQWYAVPLDTAALAGGRVTVELTIEPLDGAGAEAAWIRVWGDYPLAPGARVYDGPAVHSRILGADNAFHKLVTTGHPMLWRRVALDSLRAEPAIRLGGAWRGDDLSDAPGRQTGEYRIRLLILAPNGDLVAIF